VTATYSVLEAAQQMGAPSERWLIEQLRVGRFPGRKVGRSWRMTSDDIAVALDVCRNDHQHYAAPAGAVGLTARSRKRMVIG
jgi:hypothetical protein